MKWASLRTAVSIVSAIAVAAAPVDEGITKLVERQLPEQLHGKIQFDLDSSYCKDSYDCYEISQSDDGIAIKGSTKSALSSGLYRYLREYGHVSISWTNSTLNSIKELPEINDGPITGCAVVPYRYHFNTVTFGYTTAFYTWEDWEHLLDWASLQGINFPLAWLGYEKILIEVLKEFKFKDEHIKGLISGPAFSAWSRFGNIQGDWNSTGIDHTEINFFEDQFNLQKRILNRMIELGMTPILPSFTGFVPREIEQVYPDAKVVNSSNWNNFPIENTNVTFLDPTDPLFEKIQVSFLNKQKSEYGNITKFYTLDQYNENTPPSGDLDRLKEISKGTIDAFKAADPDAVWVMQGWLFYNEKEFWTNDRIEAYLSGPEKGELLILDLFSEAYPQWQRTKSYYGHDWIWCQLHNFGGNMDLEGSLQILFNNFTQARTASSSMVGAGLTMEGQEGNQIVYDALLYQAWRRDPYKLDEYVKQYIQSRYGPEKVPEDILQSWVDLASLVYTNDFSVADAVTSTMKSAYELEPALYYTEMGHQSAQKFYDFSKLEKIWQSFVKYTISNPEWLDHPHYHNDLVDITRQVLSNRFLDQYNQFVDSVNSTSSDKSKTLQNGQKLTQTLDTLDRVLYTDKNFLLSQWISKARGIVTDNSNKQSIQDYLEFQARNQITLWGPNGQIDNYGSKAWAGLVGSYHKKLWEKFVNFVVDKNNDPSKFNEISTPFKINWQWEKLDLDNGTKGDLLSILKELVGE